MCRSALLQTGNGLFASVLFHSQEGLSPLNAAFLVVKGRALPADLSLVETQGGDRHLSFLMMSWGLVADVDIQSEVIRWAGALRQDIYGARADAPVSHPGRPTHRPLQKKTSRAN